MNKSTSTSKATSADNPMSQKHEAIRTVIINEARKKGVPPRVALAFAWLESRFNPKAEGDLQWYQWNDGERYKKYVLANPKLAKNPWRNVPQVWHSYGLFQLLAPYFVQATENPTVLFDPGINTSRAMTKIANSLKAANGDPSQARILYAGATKLSEDVKQKIITKLYDAMKLFPASIG